MTFVTGTTTIGAGSPVTGSATCNAGVLSIDGDVGPVHFAGTFSPDGLEISGTHRFTSGGVTYTGPFYVGIALAGGSVQTGTSISSNGGAPPTPSSPVQVSVISPASGQLAVVVAKNAVTGIFGYSGSGEHVVQVIAPTATAGNPLIITFSIDVSIIDPNPLNMVMFRDGTPIGFCSGYPNTVVVVADPDPCIAVYDASHRTGSTGYVNIVVFTSHASIWTFGRVTAPSAPLSPSATPGSGRATVSWTKPKIVAAGITNYFVTPYLGTKALATRKLPGTATSAVITGLSNAKTYKFKITARNAKGNGPAASTSVTVGTPTAPRTPTATAGKKLAKVKWSAPASTNGAAIIGYVVTPFKGGVAQPAIGFKSTATAQTITGLTSGQAYTFKIAARNARGAGPQSVATNGVTPG
jgi:hypothetical protein